MNESTLVPREEMSDLDWLARNVHKWPAGHQGWCYVISNRDGTKGVATSLIGQFDCPWVRIENQEWLTRRAELQNKPSWEEAPVWAQWLAQDADGEWYWYEPKPKEDTEDDMFAFGDWASKNHFVGRGEVLGDWRDTLEKQPEQDAFTPFASIEDNQEQNMTQQQQVKQDNGWFERGELPPVGTVCLYVVSDRLSAEVEITAHAKLGLCFVQVGQSGESYVSKTAELHRFRPIRTERDELVNVFINHYGNPKGAEGYIGIADAILAAGFSLGAK